MRGLSNSTKELIEYAYRLLVADHPQTLRQLHYAVFSRREIPYENDQADYKRLSRATSVGRRAYRVWELESGRDSDGDPQTPKISWAQSALDITVLSGTVRATAIQFSSTGTLNNVSCNIGWAHRAWERCWRPAPRWHAPWSMRW